MSRLPGLRIGLAIAAVLALFGGFARTAVTGSAPVRPEEALGVGLDDGPLMVTASVVGNDLVLTCQFPGAVSALVADDSPFSLSFELDADDDRSTGQKTQQDARLGADHSIMVVLRPPSMKGPAREVSVGRWVVDAKMGEVIKSIAANPRLEVEGPQMRILVDAASVGVKKGRKIRLALSAPGQNYVDKVMTLR